MPRRGALVCFRILWYDLVYVRIIWYPLVCIRIGSYILEYLMIRATSALYQNSHKEVC